MTKQEREVESEKKYQEYISSRDKFLTELKNKVKWSIAYLIYFPIFLILFTTVLILIFIHIFICYRILLVFFIPSNYLFYILAVQCIPSKSTDSE